MPAEKGPNSHLQNQPPNSYSDFPHSLPPLKTNEEGLLNPLHLAFLAQAIKLITALKAFFFSVALVPKIALSETVSEPLRKSADSTIAL